MVVEIDLDEPLVTEVEMRGRIQRVEYENVLPLCASCNRVGHQVGACPYVSPKQPDVARPSESSTQPDRRQKSSTDAGGLSQTTKSTDEWTTMSAREKTKAHSRFDVLLEIPGEEDESSSTPTVTEENPTDKYKGKGVTMVPSRSVLGPRKSSSRDKSAKNHE
ncbi:OLC1v1027432C1 [Oldenlandia corymbosa var. corymbosa]|uniref:OLC1v1027432C1 n=1 Tax=Oldenlandia corymbosa var. corymbosa TaxID=529605 RepID=A0AAV1C9Y9_OLDCO|nr:OLC1v1027432C1 [Oldenlandia corymbosa var. corymbosa]